MTDTMRGSDRRRQNGSDVNSAPVKNNSEETGRRGLNSNGMPAKNANGANGNTLNTGGEEGKRRGLSKGGRNTIRVN